MHAVPLDPSSQQLGLGHTHSKLHSTAALQSLLALCCHTAAMWAVCMHLGSHKAASPESAGSLAEPLGLTRAVVGCEHHSSERKCPKHQHKACSVTAECLLRAAKQCKQTACYGFPTPTAPQQQEACRVDKPASDTTTHEAHEFETPLSDPGGIGVGVEKSLDRPKAGRISLRNRPISVFRRGRSPLRKMGPMRASLSIRHLDS